MPAYFKERLVAFVDTEAALIVNQLSASLIEHYSGNHQEQLRAWREQVELLQSACRLVISTFPEASEWGVLLEYPLLRLQRRLDTVTLSGQIVAVVEFKIGSDKYMAADLRQVEDYALDLRDFHAASRKLTIIPILCATDAPSGVFHDGKKGTVWPVSRANITCLPTILKNIAALQREGDGPQLNLTDWDRSPYRPVPTIVEAAELLYSGHEVSEIAHASADARNLADTSQRLIELVEYARSNQKLVVCFVTGIPGSGKTLTGLNLVHDSRLKGGNPVKTAFLSGNTPLVEVLREALARDDSRRTGNSLKNTRSAVRAEIQHLMDYLREYVTANPEHCPHENVIVFDEAQRAWDADYGYRKFKRATSEPSLFLEIMSRHSDWAVIVALVGGGQEINDGEGGLTLWGDALTNFHKSNSGRNWEVFSAPDVALGGSTTIGRSLFPAGADYQGTLETDLRLHLDVSVRNVRCESVTSWVNSVLEGHRQEAKKLAEANSDFPVVLTRSLDVAREWLGKEARGTRHVGLVASSGARRLRADGLGVSLNANERDAYVHWYLEQSGDIRSSNVLEVTANEYTCQGLELDYVGVCWGGDLLWSKEQQVWRYRALGGSKWKEVRKLEKQSFMRNKYRVLMTRSRFGMIIWVPTGDPADATRDPKALDETVEYLLECGARQLDSGASDHVPLFNGASKEVLRV